MKTKILLSLFCSLLFWANSYAVETEPNDTKAQANTLALNGSQSGAIGTATDVDWYKVTTTADGKLNLTLAVSNGLNAYFTIYDNDGTTVLGSTYTTGTSSYSVDGLAAGTYYIQIYPYFAGQMPAYTLSNTLTTATPANDAEPDSTRAQALVLPLNGSKTGHIGYYYNHHRDSVDVYKITTTADGRLRLTMSSANGQNIFIDLYDNNGTTLLGSSYTSGTAVLVDKDGLAAGTYYLRIHTFYTNEFAPYTLSDSLFVPTIANDVEPDSTRAQALALPLNGSKTGHINYYYNNHRDSVDWYKVTTNADGRLRLTMTSANGQNVFAYLYDNNGTTLLAGTYTSGSAVVVNLDGLAAGTYYIRVNTFYNTEFAPYTLSDSLFKPTEPNDAEPDSTKATALTLPLNGSVTGHVNYYYNNHRDSVDEYKLTTNADGNINLSLSIPNNTPTYFALYDNDGTTLIHQQYTSGNDNYNADGLSAGTYYIKVFTYYNNQFAPYTLNNTLSTYNANDIEPNKYASQAKTLQSNQTNNGHVDFYYKSARDSVDWFKINYTGTDGNMSVTLNVIPNITGPSQPTYMQIYKDTASSPIYSAYSSFTETANLTGLTEGYYYVRVFTYYNNQFTAYTVTPTFTQTDVAQIALTTATTATTCSNGSLQYSLSGANGPAAPYSVQLYRFGAAYRSPEIVNAATVTFSSLPPGTYYATAYGDGATGTAFTTSSTSTFLPPKPKNLSTTGITPYQATLNWTGLNCNDYYKIQYHVLGESVWQTKTTPNPSSYILKNLTRNTNYIWRIAAADSANGQTLLGNYSDSVAFTTLNDTAQIALVSSTATTACTGNSLTYVCSSSLAPYSVQLYRFGTAYGSPLSVTDTAIFSNLPPGSYYATAYGAGATDDNFGTSGNKNFAPPAASGTFETGITTIKAVVHWTPVSCANGYAVQYRKTATTTWLQKIVLGNKDSVALTGLTAGTTYQWRVAAAVGVDTISNYVLSAFTAIDNFTTATLFAVTTEGNQSSGENIKLGSNIGMSVAPNPAVNSIRIYYAAAVNEIVSLQVKDLTGKTIISRNNIPASSLSSPIDVSALRSGMYIVNIVKADKSIISGKLIIAK